jgi:hypothetical protein
MDIGQWENVLVSTVSTVCLLLFGFVLFSISISISKYFFRF